MINQKLQNLMHQLSWKIPVLSKNSFGLESIENIGIWRLKKHRLLIIIESPWSSSFQWKRAKIPLLLLNSISLNVSRLQFGDEHHQPAHWMHLRSILQGAKDYSRHSRICTKEIFITYRLLAFTRLLTSLPICCFVDDKFCPWLPIFFVNGQFLIWPANQMPMFPEFGT